MLILVNFWICLGICNVLYVQTWYVQSILISWNQMVVIRMLVSIPKILICDVPSASKCFVHTRQSKAKDQIKLQPFVVNYLLRPLGGLTMHHTFKVFV